MAKKKDFNSSKNNQRKLQKNWQSRPVESYFEKSDSERSDISGVEQSSDSDPYEVIKHNREETVHLIEKPSSKGWNMSSEKEKKNSFSVPNHFAKTPGTYK